RLLPSGNFEILGRKDSQVKLKGYRVELDEVAEAIMQHPNVIAAAALVKDKTHLVGYFSPADVDTAELHRIVSDQLPVYMVPSLWVGLNDMPQNVNGKIDKKALELMDIEMEVESLASETEEIMSRVWADVLGVALSDIGRNTSFYALGGDSISAIRLVAKAKQFGLAVSSQLVMKYPKLSEMAANTMPLQVRATENAVVTGDVPLTPIQHMNFAHPWKNLHHWNMSFTIQPRSHLQLDDLVRAVNQLVHHHDVLRTRFLFCPVNGWSQQILDISATTLDKVNRVQLTNLTELEGAICKIEKTLNLTDGPVFIVTLFESAESKAQYVHFTMHHTIADLVSWRILTDDLQTCLLNKKLVFKTTSIKEWSERLSKAALTFDPAAWLEYMGDDTVPPTDASGCILTKKTALDATYTSKFDLANVTYGTNIQELALAALTGAFGALQSDRTSERRPLQLMLESHGRETWSPDLDVSGTVGWFTCEYPVVFFPTTNLADLIRQVKQKLRGLPNQGLSYGAIKYLVPESDTVERIKSHRRHNLSFNYFGRFQEVSSDTSMFDLVQGLNIPQKAADELEFSPASLNLIHVGSELVLESEVPDWLFSRPELDALCELWVSFMQQIIDHCLDSNTIGGRTLSDVGLLPSTAVLEDIEMEMLKSQSLRPLDVEDIYPVTGLQAGMLLAMIQDPAEYVLQSVFDIRGDFNFSRLQECWALLAQDIQMLRTVFVATPHGMYQAVTKDDFSEWNELDEAWQADDIESQTKALMKRDRERGFTLATKSFQRFTGVRVTGT
ncbi:hypothetical protein DYB32_008780, partial [Aphanomyces invadans]